MKTLRITRYLRKEEQEKEVSQERERRRDGA